MNKFIVGLGGPPRQYEINGVKYIVSSSFQTARIKEHQGIVERFGKALKSQFAHLYRKCGFDIMAVDKACSTAGKEENAVEIKKETANRHYSPLLPTLP